MQLTEGETDTMYFPEAFPGYKCPFFGGANASFNLGINPTPARRPTI
jgi:hypothetical protein